MSDFKPDALTKIVDTGMQFHGCEILIVAEEYLAKEFPDWLWRNSVGPILDSDSPMLSMVEVLTVRKLEQLAGRQLSASTAGKLQGEEKMSEFRQGCPVFFNRVMDLASKALDGPHCGGVLGMLLDAAQSKTVVIRISLMRPRPDGLAVEARSKVIVVDPLESDDAITARIQDAFGKTPEPEPTICVECKHYPDRHRQSDHASRMVQVLGDSPLCDPQIPTGNTDFVTGKPLMEAPEYCCVRNSDGKCKHYSPKEEKITE